MENESHRVVVRPAISRSSASLVRHGHSLAVLTVEGVVC